MDSLKGATSGVTNTVSSGAQKAGEGAQSAGSTARNTVSSGAQQASEGAQSAGSTAQGAVSSGTEGATKGTEQWNAMSEDQKKQTFDSLPKEKKQGLSYTEWVKQGYHNQMENWMPWIEDFYLRWFTNDNKASYATKDALDKSKVTGIDQVDTLQDGVNGVVGQQVGKGGLLQPVGDMASSEGINRAERGGKDEHGNVAPGGGGGVGSYVSSAGGSVWSGAKGAGGYVGGMFGGKKEGETGSK